MPPVPCRIELRFRSEGQTLQDAGNAFFCCHTFLANCRFACAFVRSLQLDRIRRHSAVRLLSTRTGTMTESRIPQSHDRQRQFLSDGDLKPGRQAADRVGGFEGLGPMTRVATSFGDMHAQALRERDMLRTKIGGFAKIESVDRFVLDEDFLSYHPEALPIRIRAGAFGRNVPCTDVILAPFQRITASQQLAGPQLSRAADALARPGVMRAPETMITYTVIRCAKPVSVLCEGLWVDI